MILAVGDLLHWLGPILPGVWLLVLAFVLDRLLRRFFDPVPLRVWGFFAVALLALFGGVLFGDETFLPVGDIQRFVPYEELGLEVEPENYLQRDLTHAITPWEAAVRRAYSEGRWPLWNTSSGAGVPLLANPQAMPFHPLVLVTFPISLPGALGVIAALRVLVAFVFTFLLLRRQGLSEAPAVFGGVAYGLGGFMILWLGWPHTNSAAMVPVLLYATATWADEGRRRDLVFVTLAIFGVFVAGHPETALYALTVGGCFALAKIRAAAGRSAARGWRVFRGWALGAILGGLLAAPVLLPSAAFLPETNRYETVTARKARLTQDFLLSEHWRRMFFTAPERILPAVARNAWGDNRWGEYWGYHNINEAAGGFVGTLTFLAALLAMLPKARRRFPQEIFMVGLVGVCFVILLRPPLYMELTLRLPPFDKSPNFHGRMVMMLGFALAYLAACTLERWRRDELPRLRTLGAALFTGGLVAWLYLAHPFPEDPTALAELRHTSLVVQLVTLGLGAACLLYGGRKWRVRGAWIPVGLVAVELLVIHGDVNTPAPREYFYPPSPPLSFIQAKLDENEEGHRMVGHHAALPPEFAAVYDLPDLRGLGPSVPIRVWRLLDPLRSRPKSFLFNVPDHSVLDLLGVRFILAEPGVEMPPPLVAAYRGPNGVVWERPDPLSRLYLPRSAVPLSQIDVHWKKWTAENPSFRDRALYRPTPDHGEAWTARRPDASTLEMGRVDDTHVRARVELAEERLVASGIYQDGGWHLLVDGERRPTTLASGPLVAAWVPAGEHRLDLVYRPPGFLAGMFLASLAAAGLLIIAVPPPATRESSPHREG